MINSLNLEYFFNLFYRFFTEADFWFGWWRSLSHWLVWLKLLLVVFSLVFLVGSAVILFKLVRLRREQSLDLRLSLLEAARQPPPQNERWQKILGALASENPADWKVAVIEADNILDELTKKMAYPGENLGERLKAIEPSDFETLDDAWEAHKVRNRIAHESGYDLSKREAQTTIEHFRRVFEEFDYFAG